MHFFLLYAVVKHTHDPFHFLALKGSGIKTSIFMDHYPINLTVIMEKIFYFHLSLFKYFSLFLVFLPLKYLQTVLLNYQATIICSLVYLLRVFLIFFSEVITFTSFMLQHHTSSHTSNILALHIH